MSYREYTTRDGRLVRQHNNGHRFTLQRLVILPTQPGDESTFERQAMAALQDLRDRDGETGYKAWFERSFEQDGKTADDFTWQQILAAAQIELEHPSECSCFLPDQSCAVCRSIAHVLSVAELVEQS